MTNETSTPYFHLSRNPQFMAAFILYLNTPTERWFTWDGFTWNKTAINACASALISQGKLIETPTDDFSHYSLPEYIEL